MPLAFNSLSHGEIAFGFFNIETDMLILDRYFLFASDFCLSIAQLAETPRNTPITTEWSVYALDQEEIGSLMGAIHGVELRGFMGDVYRVFPFPQDAKAFAQNPEGYRTRRTMEEMIEAYQTSTTVPVITDASGTTIDIGDYMFSREGFHSLLKYVWGGGYPYWKLGNRPEYLLRMKESIHASRHAFFDGITAFI